MESRLVADWKWRDRKETLGNFWAVVNTFVSNHHKISFCKLKILSNSGQFFNISSLPELTLFMQKQHQVPSEGI
jgi:hypothetical protein